MIRTLLSGPDGRPVLVIGLSADDLKRLQDGQTIVTGLSEQGLIGWSMAVVHAATEEMIESELIRATAKDRSGN